MKRIHLFEFEDFRWFPNWIRECMTLYISALHRTVDTASAIVPLVQRGLAAGRTNHVIDLCSGAGGPMIEVVQRLNRITDHGATRLTLTDLFPNLQASEAIERDLLNRATYCQQPVDAANVPKELIGMRTMICSLHHMKPELVKSIFLDAASKRQPFLAFELGDNSAPIWLWWVAIPIGFLLTLVLTPLVRPVRFVQLFFTYVIPVVPIFIAWDGAVSNARTYTKQDIEKILSQFESPGYDWEIGATKNPKLPGSMSYVLGLPRCPEEKWVIEHATENNATLD